LAARTWTSSTSDARDSTSDSGDLRGIRTIAYQPEPIGRDRWRVADGEGQIVALGEAVVGRNHSIGFEEVQIVSL